MKRILFVDDDPLVLRIYREALSKQGFQVDTANDGVSAAKALRAIKPDLMVLDLMMPKLSGVEVLKFVREEQKLAGRPVVVLSNSYMQDLAHDAAVTGAQKALLKVRCTPSILLEVIRGLLEYKPATQDAVLLAATKIESEAPEPKSSKPVNPGPVGPAPPAEESHKVQPKVEPDSASDAQFRQQARDHFLKNAAASSTSLRAAFQGFAKAKADGEREKELQKLYRNIHFLAASAGLAECYPIARMASVLEAMLFELTTKPDLSTPSLLRTTAQAVDVFDKLFQHARGSKQDSPLAAEILAVDDDPLSNRLVVGALRHAQLHARSTEDPLTALQWLRDKQHNLVLLDIEMPGMDGLELCKQLRRLPGYQKTPVIYVTSHSDFESRARSALSGGDDLIGKPVFPLELAVKAMAHLLSSQVDAKGV